MENYLKEISEIVSLPFNEVIKDTKILQIGSRIIYISNYKKIINYGSNSIDLKLIKSTLHVEGENLMIKQMDKGEIVIVGQIYCTVDGNYVKK